jgi:DNA-binding response OmpR family regulator
MTKILLVDDEPITTRLLELLLSKDGYQALSVNDSRKALSVASVFSPDIIILDLMMPVVNGIDICKALRADPKFAKTPILFYTALGDSDNKVAAYEAGATDFFTKPIYPAELRLKIKALLDAE